MILLLTFTLTAVMTGIIWFVQINHYPLFLKIGKAEFISYEKEHTRLAGLLIAPLMLIELALSVLLVFNETKQHTLAVSALALLIVIWASTFAGQVPLHQKLIAEYNKKFIQQLIRTNWLRTVFWTVRLLILGSMLGSVMLSAAKHL
ncbi:MAG: hypothetical protein SH857_07735 [Chitinophagales bacterium]|nr:hypothetical protein [Chitinophagales bacterium]